MSRAGAEGAQSLDALSSKPSASKRVSAIAYFMVASILTQSATKSILTVFAFNYPITLCLAQMAFIAPVCAVISGADINLQTLASLVPLGLINCANIVSGMFGTGGLSLPMFIVLRRFTMVLTVALEELVFHQGHDWQVFGSIGVMILGAIVAAATDLSFNFWAYTAVLLNDLFTAAYLVMLKHFHAVKRLDTTTLLLYNALISMLPLLGAAFVTGELGRLPQYSGELTMTFWLTAAAAVCLGLSISHSTYLCTRMNEPLTTSVAGNFKNLLMTAIGMIAFGDYRWDAKNLAGIGISMTGAVWYAWFGVVKARRPTAGHGK